MGSEKDKPDPVAMLMIFHKHIKLFVSIKFDTYYQLFYFCLIVVMSIGEDGSNPHGGQKNLILSRPIQLLSSLSTIWIKS